METQLEEIQLEETAQEEIQLVEIALEEIALEEIPQLVATALEEIQLEAFSQKSGHSSWEVRFNDDLLDVMNPGESRTADLRISIPDDLDPGYYGFTLFAASALGNFSVNTTLVVNVTATHDLSFQPLH